MAPTSATLAVAIVVACIQLAAGRKLFNTLNCSTVNSAPFAAAGFYLYGAWNGNADINYNGNTIQCYNSNTADYTSAAFSTFISTTLLPACTASAACGSVTTYLASDTHTYWGCLKKSPQGSSFRADWQCMWTPCPAVAGYSVTVGAENNRANVGAGCVSGTSQPALAATLASQCNSIGVYTNGGACGGYNLYNTNGQWWGCLKDGAPNTNTDPSFCYYTAIAPPPPSPPPPSPPSPPPPSPPPPPALVWVWGNNAGCTGICGSLGKTCSLADLDTITTADAAAAAAALAGPVPDGSNGGAGHTCTSWLGGGYTGNPVYQDPTFDDRCYYLPDGQATCEKDVSSYGGHIWRLCPCL